ncbi:MAG: outer membrane beta-barrel protein [Chitinophagaceae bacterium]|nr:outer membrane beta-barrel protein [Chitinophagaceae bacterium]
MLRSVFALLFLVFSCFHAVAQSGTGSISGKVVDSLQQPLEGATILVRSATNNTAVKTALTDNKGSFLLEKMKEGSYHLIISMSGFAKDSSNITLTAEKNTINTGTIKLVPLSKDLQGITITAQRPPVERKIDRTVVNVDQMISAAGSTALEVLEKSPGVSVDNNGVISLQGKNGVVIFIDDKPTYLSGPDLESYLRSLPASSVDQIELMTNPPAKYDAAGGAGVINIRLKRTKAKGFNGSLNNAYTQGRYAKSNNSFNFNYRNGKINTFGTLTQNQATNFSDLNINRHFIKPDGSRNYDFLQHTYIKSSGLAFSGKVGADYYATEKNTFGIVLTGVTRKGQRDNDNSSRFINTAFQLDSTIVANNTQDNSFSNAGVNLNFRRRIRKNGPELSVDADYLRYSTGNEQLFDNYTYLPNNTLSQQERLTGDLPAAIDIYSLKTDYTHPLKKGWKIDAGAKSSQIRTDNVADYFLTKNNTTTPDYDKTNHFIYKEDIHAAYINSSHEGKRWSMQLGLRTEYTISDGRQLGNAVKPDSSFKRTYASLFPTAYLNYKLDSAGNNILTLDYGRRINRPFYQDLNPFISPLDKFTYYVGNPFLLPAYTHNVQLSYSYKNKITVAFRYSSTLNNTNETIEIKDGTYYSRPGNIGKITNISGSLQGDLPIKKWLSFGYYTEVTNIHSQTNFYTGYLDTKGTYWFIQPNFRFTFTRGWSAQIDGFYQTNITSNQFILLERGRLNAGVSKKLGTAFTVRATANDILYTQINRGIINNLANTKANWRNANDTRVFTVSLAWRFGKTISDTRRHNQNSAQQEQNRVRE